MLQKLSSRLGFFGLDLDEGSSQVLAGSGSGGSILRTRYSILYRRAGNGILDWVFYWCTRHFLTEAEAKAEAEAEALKALYHPQVRLQCIELLTRTTHLKQQGRSLSEEL